jgi:glutathione reductase (NADPH)
MILIGGGYISFEFAHVAAAYGSRVVVLNHSRRVLKAFDADLAETAVEAARDAGIEVHLGAEPAAIRRVAAGLEVVCEDGTPRVAAAVYACIGRRPAVGGLNLEALGIDAGAGGLEVDERMRVAGRDDLFAIGDCAASPALAPVADREAAVAASRLTGGDLAMDYAVVPSVCFSRPPLARVGLTAEEASARGLAYDVREGATTGWPNLRRLGARHGRYKVLIDPDGLILGAHLLTAGAGDLINVFALAMRAGIPARSLKEIPWAYPTLTSDLKYMV